MEAQAQLLLDGAAEAQAAAGTKRKVCSSSRKRSCQSCAKSAAQAQLLLDGAAEAQAAAGIKRKVCSSEYAPNFAVKGSSEAEQLLDSAAEAADGSKHKVCTCHCHCLGKLPRNSQRHEEAPWLVARPGFAPAPRCMPL